MAKKLIILFTISVLIILPTTTFIGVGRTFSLKNSFIEDRYDFKICSINASNPYDYGFKMGKILNTFYRFLNNFVFTSERTKINESHIKDQIKDIEKYCPFFLEELKGLSASTHIKLENLIILQNKLSSLSDDQCTATLATGKATKNNETFLTFNIDAHADNLGATIHSILIGRSFSEKLWVVRINTMRYRYVFLGIPIIKELPLLNEKGLGWGCPGTHFNQSENLVDTGPGIGTIILDRMAMMTCKNVSEVADLFKNSDRGLQRGEGWQHQFDGATSCFCDSEGGILVIEMTHNYIATVFGNSTDITGAPEGILWHANHHQWLDPNLTGSLYPNEIPSSGFRAERARELLEQYYGNITLDICKKITRDYGGGYDKNKRDSGDICRIPDKNEKRMTDYAWIIVPKELAVYITHTNPYRGIFWKHDFSKLFAS